MDIKKKIDQVKEELQKFVSSLKNKLSKSKNNQEDEKTKPNIDPGDLSSKNVEDKQNESTNDEAKEDTKKKEKPKFTEQDLKRKKIIQIIVVLAIAVFLFAPDEEVIKEVQKSVENKIDEVVKNEGEKKLVNLPSEKPDEGSRGTPKKSEIREGDFKDDLNFEEKEKIVDVKIKDNSLPQSLNGNENIGTIRLPEEKKTVKQESVAKTKRIEKKVEKTVGKISKSGEDIIDFAKKIQKKAEEESKIKTIQKVNYLKVGRGLAYNCKEKFWACLNKEQYFNCRDNQERFDLQKKARECYPLEVYSSVEDCKIIQIHNINILKKTDFCKGL